MWSARRCIGIIGADRAVASIVLQSSGERQSTSGIFLVFRRDRLAKLINAREAQRKHIPSTGAIRTFCIRSKDPEEDARLKAEYYGNAMTNIESKFKDRSEIKRSPGCWTRRASVSGEMSPAESRSTDSFT
jgi:hypothetical protein